MQTQKIGKVDFKLQDYYFTVKQGKTEDYYCEDRKAYIYKSIIHLKVNDIQTRFNFYGSIADYEKGESIYKVQELAFCLYCFLSDGFSYHNAVSFNDFCSEFGYDTDSIKALNIYKACGGHTRKLLD